MSELIGIVTGREPDEYARVLTNRNGGCGGCHTDIKGCHSCLSNARAESLVANPLHAKEGDVVKVRLSSSGVYLGAFILYLLPIIGLVVAALVGIWAASVMNFTESLGAGAGAITGLLVGLAAGMLLNRSATVLKKITPVITEVLSFGGGMKKKRS